MNDNNQFSVIRGGMLENSGTSKKVFVYAEITDTRLMGVVWMHIFWKLPDNEVMKHYHQFYYFDAEEYAFDTFESILGTGDDDEDCEVNEKESKMTGGLGGRKIRITLREAKYLVQEYASLSARLGEELPGNAEEYKDMLSPVIDMTREEEEALNKKQCKAMTNPFETINYFVMRCTGRDFYAAKLLTEGYVKTDIFKEHKMAALIQNRIEISYDDITGSSSSYKMTGKEGIFSTFDTISTYMSEALIEYDGKYYINVSEIKMAHLAVVGYRRINTFRITEDEVAMRTARREFASVYQLDGPGDEFIDRTTELTEKAMITEHETGRLYMIFYPHNEHVKNQVYNLNDDVMGFYYVLDNGQILLTAYSRANIRLLELDLMTSIYGGSVTPLGKYQFNDSTVVDFINNGFEDFEEFIDVISIGFDDDDGRD